MLKAQDSKRAFPNFEHWMNGAFTKRPKANKMPCFQCVSSFGKRYFICFRFFLYITLSLFALNSCKTTPKITTQSKEVLNSWSKEIVYFLLVDRFYNGDKKNDFNVNKNKILHYHGGDLKGLTAKLKYINKLNISTLLFTPINDNRDKDFFGHWGLHGYWIIDHYKIDEHFGTNDDFKGFNSKRLKNGKKLLLDIVLNHVDWDHPWIKKHPEWFHTMESIKNWEDPKELVEGRVTGLPDLDQSNPEVYKKLLDYSKYWIDFSKADGFRLDAVKHIEHSFWKKYIFEINKYVLEKHYKSNFLFLAEILHGDPKYYLPYIDDGFNAFYDYPLYYTVADVFARNKSLYMLPARLQSEEKIFPKNIILATFIDNHDMPRFLNLSKKVNYKDMEQALAFYMTIRGLPVIYYGTEGHLMGKTGELGRKSITFNRTPSYKFISKLNKIRRTSASLSHGQREELLVDHDKYVFRKISPVEESIVIITRSDDEINFDLHIENNSLFSKVSTVTDQISKRKFKLNENRLHINAKAKDFIILTLKGYTPRYEFLQKNKASFIKFNIDIALSEKLNEEKLYIIGNHESLGNWNPQKALGPLSKISQKKYRAKLKIENGEVFEFKFIKIDRNNKVTWESRSNRYYYVTSKKLRGITSLKWDE